MDASSAPDTSAPDTVPPEDAGGPAEMGAPSGPIPLPPSGIAMGATVVAVGTEFRVWAPNASGVSVFGDFGAQPVPMSPEDGGLFSTTVATAHAGQHYNFTVTSGGNSYTRVDPRARQMESPTSDGIIIDPRAYAWQTGSFLRPAASGAVIYEMYIPAFNVPTGAAYGTFLSAIDRLDYLQGLGINLIELMPSNQYDGMDDWGYDPVGYFAPHAAYGTPDDLRQLVDQAHARGIGVMLDVVYNHYDQSLVGLWCWDGDCPNDNGIYFFSDATNAYTPWGPRPDYATTGVSNLLIDGLFSWLSEYRFDGFRWDSTSNIRAIMGMGTVPGGNALMATANDVLHADFPGALFVAEDFEGDSAITAPTSAGGAGFDSQWDGFYGNVDGAVTQPAGATRDVGAIGGSIGFSYNGVATQRVIFTEDHDLANNPAGRLPAQIDGTDPTSLFARKGSMLAAGVALTSPGIPMLLQGQELLETGAWSEYAVPPVNWSDVTTNAPILAFYTDLLRLRRNLDGVSAGLLGANVNVFHVNTGAEVLAWDRWGTPGDDVIIVANFSGTPFPQYIIGLPSPGVWHVVFNGDSTKYSADFGNTAEPDVTATSTPRDGFPADGTVALAPYDIIALSQ
jgi:1,4-alpha-glucan branching enzyme